MLETERLFLRPFLEADIDAVFAMRGDREVMRFIREPQKREESVDWLRFVSSRWEKERIGFCALIEKETGKFVGWCGIWQLKETGEFEIGYAISKECWGKGFATEAAREFLRYAFEELELEKVVSVARSENASSRRVMEKIGMMFVKTGTFYKQFLVQYVITREEFFRGKI